MSNVFATYVVLVAALAMCTIALLALPSARQDFRAWHWLVAVVSVVLLLGCLFFFGAILLESPSSREKPELVAPFVLAAVAIGLVLRKLLRGDGRRNRRHLSQ